MYRKMTPDERLAVHWASANDGSPTIPHDWKELLDGLNNHGVEFLIVGAHALALHGVPRLTQDLGLWIKRSQQNGERIREL